jgi:hypothetical protein
VSKDPEVEALLQTVPFSFAHFDRSEVAELRAYQSNVEELNRRKLANQQSFTYEVSTDGSLSSGVDEDDIVALATTIRKLAWGGSEAPAPGQKAATGAQGRPQWPANEEPRDHSGLAGF